MTENITYDSFFINLTDLPNPKTPERKALITRERNRCLGGVYVDGVFISGWLYWHINFWWITDDAEDEFGNIIPWEAVASLRDNEWIRAEALERCKNFIDPETGQRSQQGYIEVGLRQGGKTTFESSYTAYSATMFKNSQNIIISGSGDDLTNVKLRLDFGISKIWSGLKKPKLDKDARAKQTRLGYKDKDNENVIWSYIIARNIAEGHNTEGPAGVTAKSLIMDEIGKASFSQALEAAKPAFMSKFGWRATPILVGTGGAFENGADAERIFYHPGANNFLEFVHEETGERTGLFMPGTFRTDCKYRTNLAVYLIGEGKLPDGIYPELAQIPIDVSDKSKALKKIKSDRAKKAMDPDKTEYLKQIMYFPLTPKECFLSSSENFFNTDIARHQKDRLETEYPGLKIGDYIELVDDGDKIVHKPSTKTPVSTYPKPPNEDTNCPIVVIEHPIKDPPYGLYVMGIDPYRFEKAPNSDSLGAAYVFKRSYDVLSDSFQDIFVAWYVARPDSKDTWNNNVRLLIKYYNAMALCENDEMSFIDYMIAKNEGHRLMDTPEWIKEYNPTSAGSQRSKGISSAPKNIELFNTNYKQYLEEHFHTAPVAGENEGRKLLGVAKVMDTALLDETIKWNKDGNFDRIRAASIAVTAARKMDALQVKVSVENTDPRFVINNKHKSIKTPLKELGTTYRYVNNRSKIQRLMK